ncbi:hypothetical protein FQN60_000496 [Etheostoma spectabile]|uniref:Uncharacterized protein n=1 Tax=Etheostoma spectabile TaxID=54343 RepID=A0A5J5D1E6_9PERO|nr:hypothetical protein FQN60_000496 [Etheostoma spectabile]
MEKKRSGRPPVEGNRKTLDSVSSAPPFTSPFRPATGGKRLAQPELFFEKRPPPNSIVILNHREEESWHTGIIKIVVEQLFDL